jgi:hypothetical protein
VVCGVVVDSVGAAEEAEATVPARRRRDLNPRPLTAARRHSLDLASLYTFSPSIPSLENCQRAACIGRQNNPEVSANVDRALILNNEAPNAAQWRTHISPVLAKESDDPVMANIARDTACFIML